jgi:uncharacterized protein YcaQ
MLQRTAMLTINIDTARRFILGKQGLWPGRRWRGIEGTEQAMRAMAYFQLDPLQIIARSQDIKLHGRVLDYTPGMWEDVAYRQRIFFDWGGWLAVRPIDEFQLGHMSSCQLPALDAIAKHIDEYHSEPLLRLPNGRLGWLKKGSEGSAQPNLVAHSFPWSCANRSGW